jgi:hypothetical protein
MPSRRHREHPLGSFVHASLRDPEEGGECDQKSRSNRDTERDSLHSSQARRFVVPADGVFCVSGGAIRTHGGLVWRYRWRVKPPDDTSRFAGTLVLAACVSYPNVPEAGLRAATEKMIKAVDCDGLTDSVRVC